MSDEKNDQKTEKTEKAEKTEKTAKANGLSTMEKVALYGGATAATVAGVGAVLNFFGVGKAAPKS